jgi:diguanylate cyclase (GGDEF)-like protein/PAS domain S-box-containing protein
MSNRRDVAVPTRRTLADRILTAGIVVRVRERRSAMLVELGKLVLVGAGYYVAGSLSLRLALVGAQVTPIWPPTGIALAGLLLFGRRVWPAIALAAFLVNAPIGPSLMTAAGVAVGNTAAPLLCATLLQRAGFRLELDRVRDAMAIVLLGALSMTVSATCGTATLLLSGSVSISRFWPTWSVWWTGDAMGVLIVAPFLLSWRSARSPSPMSWPGWAEAAALFGGLVAVAQFGFQSPLQMKYLMFPFLAWAAWRFGQRGAATAALVASSTAIWAAVKGIGPFAQGTVDRMVALQVFNATVALVSIVLAAFITERRRAEDGLRRNEEWVRGLLVSAPDAILMLGEDGGIQLANPRAEEMFGYGRDELIGLRVEALVPRDLRAAHVRHRADYQKDLTTRPMGLGLDLAGRRKDGTEFPIEIGLSSFGTADGRFVTCIISDITTRKRAEDDLAQRALHDPLTNLANRALFMDKLAQALARSERHESQVAVLFMDLDHFKVINDSLGHEVGDVVLSRIADRLRTVLRPEDTASRFGGDEFVILLQDIRSEHQAVAIADRMARSVAEPIALEAAEVTVTTSVGIAIGQGTADGPEAIVRDADQAVYRAKEHGRARCELFDQAMRARAAKRLRTENELRRGIEMGHLCLHFQPVVSVDDGRIRSLEALVRWNHPQRGVLLPEEFISLAEETGLIGPLGSWVLEEACRQAASWRPVNPGHDAPTVLVNLSARQLARADFEDTVWIALHESGLQPSALTLEITETVLMDALPATLGLLSRLREAGVHLAIDDFGTGYSSLNYLKRFPVDALKVDRSFVNGLGRDPEDSAIVAAVVSLAHALGLSAVAEGVETKDQLRQLRRIDCDLAQGNYFAPPQSAEDLEDMFGLETACPARSDVVLRRLGS